MKCECPYPLPEGKKTCSNCNGEVDIAENEWTEELQIEFLSLVEKSALGEANQKDMERLNGLQQLRRSHLSKRSYAELCADREAQLRFDHLMKALSSYLER